MSQSKDHTASDDEFHDAISDASPTSDRQPGKSNPMSEEAIDELIQKHSELNLPDDDGDQEGASSDKKETGAAGDSSAEKPDAIGDNELSVEELTELEKNLSPEQLLENKEKADKMKLEANELFKNDESKRAIDIYTEALNICPLSNTKERAVLFGNRAAAKIKLDAKQTAIEDCTKAIDLWPEYVRVLLRRAKLYEQTDKLDEALEDYKRVYELDPAQQDARLAQVRLPPLINERNEKLKAEMMGSLKDLGNMILKPFGLSTNNFQMQQDPSTGSYSINFNQNAR